MVQMAKKVANIASILLIAVMLLGGCQTQSSPSESTITPGSVSTQAAGERTALVVHVQGEAHYETATQRTRLAVGTLLTEGHAVQTGTGGTATLLVDQDKFIYIAPETSFTLASLHAEDVQSTVLILKAGTLISDIQEPLPDDDIYEVHTPDLVMAIRGTIASVSCHEEESAVLLLDGNAEVEFSSSTSLYTLEAGWRVSGNESGISLTAAEDRLLNPFEQEFLAAHPELKSSFEQEREQATPDDARITANHVPETASTPFTLDDAKQQFGLKHPKASIVISKREGEAFYIEGHEGNLIYKMKFLARDGSVVLDVEINRR